MNNYIVYEPSAKIREIARQALKGNWPKMFVGVLIFYTLSTFISEILDSFFVIVRYIPIYGEYFRAEIPYAGALYEFLVMGPLMCGFAMFMLTFFRDKKVNYALNLEGFGMFGKTFCMYLLYSVKVYLWSLLFVVPGIIAVYRYSQCFYLRVDHPDWTASQCINESKRLMRGNKGKLFCLQLTFFGYALLASLPYAIFDNFTETEGMTYVLIASLLWLPMLVVNLYIETATVTFYEIVTRNLVVFNTQGIPYSQPSYENETWEDIQSKKNSDDYQKDENNEEKKNSDEENKAEE
ncbi:MAG: hypothetical protein DBY08_02590 [Clostridiales bacterium]|nr:DUF975 family protein [Bacillota bacterium]MEE0517887.1 DUF975 family protein [Anaerovoracaceae bacterium]PWL94739.1 MAG: hypothetical protein DBY08_02590 [Clostridiales bacterium]